MKKRISLLMAVTFLVTAVPAFALSPGFEHFIASAGRGPGAEGSMWVTDLYAFNPNEFDVTVDIYWLFRDQDNSSMMPATVTLPARQSVIVKDIVKNVFGQDEAYGGFRIVGREGIIAGQAYIYDMNGPNGQAFEASPIGAGIYAADSAVAPRPSALATTQIFGIENNEDFRTNFVGVGVDPSGSTFDLRIYDADGSEVLALDGVAIGPWEPKLWSLTDLGLSDLDEGYISVTMTSGGGIFAGSKISNVSNDSHTLESWTLLGN